MRTRERHAERKAEPRTLAPQMLLISIPLMLAMLVLGASCGGASGSGDDPGAGFSATATTQSSTTAESGDVSTQNASSKTALVDPPDGGFEITMGEWAVAPEAKVIRPASSPW